MKLLVFSLFLGSIHLLVGGVKVCLPMWNEIPAHFLTNRGNLSSVTVLSQCMATCELNDKCVTVDFDKKRSQCWLQYDTIGNSTIIPNITRYQIKRNCTDFPEEECRLNWTQHTINKSTNGLQVNYWTQYDCFTYCRYTPECVMVDFDNSTSPPCWMYKESNISTDINTNAKYDGPLQYRPNKTCSTAVKPVNKQLGRCDGQWFPNTTWCPTGSNISKIQDVVFKLNPLCYYRNAEDAVPPDAYWLLSIAVSYLNKSYYEEILSCENDSNCYIQARTEKSIETNFVLISYNCTPEETSISTDELTTKRATPVPSRTTLVPSSTPLVPSSTILIPSNEVVMDSYRSKALIIGLVVGFGGLFLLIILIVAVILLFRRRQRGKQEIITNDYKANYYYNQSTMHKGVNPDNQLNEISMAVDTL